MSELTIWSVTAWAVPEGGVEVVSATVSCPDNYPEVVKELSRQSAMDQVRAACILGGAPVNLRETTEVLELGDDA